MTKSQPSPRQRIGRFLLLQVVFLGGFAWWTGSHVLALRQRNQLPSIRTTPLQVKPTYDLDTVVSDEQLQAVLAKVVPRNQKQNTRINHVDHALRFWRLDANFEQADVLSGTMMRDILTDHKQFVRLYGARQPSLLLDEPTGVGVRVQEGPATSSHADHTLASLVEVGTPLDYPVRTPTRETTLREMITNSLSQFSLNQVEYEWSAFIYTLMLPPQRSWVTSEGQQVDFDLLARRIMREKMPQGVCFGNHRLYTLVIMLRIDDQLETKILSDAERKNVLDYLRRMTGLLVAHQHPDGFWDADWPSQQADPDKSTEADRLLATGHALEWWAMSPEELLPPERDTLIRAGQWLCRTVVELDDKPSQDYYPYLTHVGRALSLWRSREPAQVMAGRSSRHGTP